MKTGCVVVAAGRGERAGFGFNKVFAPVAGVSVLTRTLRALAQSGLIDEIVLVLSKTDFGLYKELTEREGVCPLVARLAEGGKTRAESVRSGLSLIDCDIVLVHDAARPFVTKEIIENVIADAVKFGSGVISTPVTDTVKRVDGDGFAVETLKRSELRAVQTPQAFRFDMLKKAYESVPLDAGITDDAMLFERMYSRVKLTEAESAAQNIKLTTPLDYQNAARRLALPRTGTGYDVHKLVEGRKLILCGVDIPYEKGLLGHSDADVALHALMDALLGAAALGDIGKLFPDSDMRYKGISSMLLLEETLKQLREKGFEPVSCDVTIVCQRPKLAPHIALMRSNIAGVLKLDPSRVSVKATTTEGLGFEGEGLGISAQAVATVIENGGLA